MSPSIFPDPLQPQPPPDDGCATRALIEPNAAIDGPSVVWLRHAETLVGVERSWSPRSAAAQRSWCQDGAGDLQGPVRVPCVVTRLG